MTPAPGTLSLPARVARGLAGLVYPVNCVLCGVPSGDTYPVCLSCRGKVRLNPPVLKIGAAASAAPYEGAMKELIHLFKYGRKISLAAYLSSLLVDFCARCTEMCCFDAVVPVPLSWWRGIKRGFNQAEELARPLAAEHGIKLLPGALARTRMSVPQSTLNRLERPANVHGAFRVKRAGRISGANILLVDDVFTTGSTLGECSAALRGAGAVRVSAVTLAKGG